MMIEEKIADDLYERYSSIYRLFIYLYDKKNVGGRFCHNSPLTNKQYISIMRESKAILDVPQICQKGPTTRAFDALLTETKVITVNKYMKYYPVYSDNMIIVDRDNINIPDNFMAKEYVINSYHSLSIDMWIKKDWIIDCREDNNIMKILVINCHCDNRGDEAAIHAMVDELNKLYTNLSITLAIRGIGTRYPNMPSNVKMIRQFCPGSFKSKIAHNIAIITKGTLALSHNERILVNEIKDSDIVVHAPGGPSIGDLYYDDEPSYLSIFDLIISMNKKYMFYAPSMGPFKDEKRNMWRKKDTL